MLKSFPSAKQKANGYYEHNPGDGTHFDFWVRADGSIGMKVWSGKGYEEVLKEGDPPRTPRDLYSHNGNDKPGVSSERQKLDLIELANYLKIDHRFLFNLGYRDGWKYTNKGKGFTSVGVKLGGYCKPDGSEHDRVKVRLSLTDKFRFVWDENTPGDPIPCGLHRLDEGRQAGFSILCEGESDWATFMFHGFPALGISGADAIRSLDVSLLADIPKVYIIEEPDQVKRNQEEGKGFYKSVRQHLREQSYAGEIFSIRFEQATGCKDPNELHKILYQRLKFNEETVFLAEIRKHFREIMIRALEQALPEGETSLEAYVKQAAPPPLPPATESEKLAWFAQLCAVPATVLSPAHKITLMVIILHTYWWEPTLGWYKIDADFLSQQAGMDKKSFLKNLSYLTKNVKLFVKRHDRTWYTPEGKKKSKCTTDLYIRPSDEAWLTYPSTFRVAEGQEERKHGGVQQPKKNCVNCQSEELDLYELQFCRTCQYAHYVLKESQESTCVEAMMGEEYPHESIVSTVNEEGNQQTNLGSRFLEEQTAEEFHEDMQEPEGDEPKHQHPNLGSQESEGDETENQHPKLGTLSYSFFNDTQVGYPILGNEEDEEERSLSVPASLEVVHVSGETALFSPDQVEEAKLSAQQPAVIPFPEDARMVTLEAY